MTNEAEDNATPLIVQPQQITFDQPLELACGRVLPSVTIQYETLGELNADRSNAILICHALSGDAHVAGYRPEEDPDADRTRSGWWDLYVGPGKPIDTNRYFILCANVLGGCKGTTGPNSIDPETGKPYGLDFPVVTIGDMVETQKRLVDHFGIDRLLCVTGGSMGGMQALEWSVRYPERMDGLMPIATTSSLSAQSLAFDAVGRNAILADAATRDGEVGPGRGLAIARMLGHITYLSEASMHEKFGRRLRYSTDKAFAFDAEFDVETYLDYQGEKFIERFDAASYLYLTRAMDYFDLGEGRGGLRQALASTRARFFVISFTSDWLFTARQSQQIVESIALAGRTVSYVNIDSSYGHDSFLLPCPSLENAIAGFLDRLACERATGQPKAERDREIVTSGTTTERRRLDLERISDLITENSTVLDLGCGDGLFLEYLAGHGARHVQGVEIDEDRAVAAIQRGVDVIQADLDEPLHFFPDKSYDYVLLSRTLQTVRNPTVVMDEMLRIGRSGIVTFPNFGYWRNRHVVAWLGRVPVTRNLPFSWIDTPNLHHLSLYDFEDWCRDVGVQIEQRIAMDFASDAEIRWLPNLRATDAIYVISRAT